LKLGIERWPTSRTSVYGALIIAFLLFEPMGLGKIYTQRAQLPLVWPFGYARK
jgi:branched-chain amino acid transport system permease protein